MKHFISSQCSQVYSNLQRHSALLLTVVWNLSSETTPLLLVQGVIPQTGHQVWILERCKERSLWACKSRRVVLGHCGAVEVTNSSCVALWAEAEGGDADVQHCLNAFLHQADNCSELKISSKIANPMRQLIPCTDQQSGVWSLLILSVWTCSNIWTLGIQSEFWLCWREWQQHHWPQPVNTQRNSDFPLGLMHSPSSSEVPSSGELRHNSRHEIHKPVCIYNIMSVAVML